MAEVDAKIGRVATSFDRRQPATTHQSFPARTIRKKGGTRDNKLPWGSGRLQGMVSRKSTSGDNTSRSMTPLSPGKIAGGHTSKIARNLSNARADEEAGTRAGAAKNAAMSTCSSSPASLKPLSTDLAFDQKSVEMSGSLDIQAQVIDAAPVTVVEADGSVTLTLAEDSAPLRFSLCPASDEAMARAGKLESFPDLSGAQVHALLPTAGGKIDRHIQNVLKKGHVLAEVNGRDVRYASFSEVLRLFGASPVIAPSPKKNSSHTNKGDLLSHHDLQVASVHPRNVTWGVAREAPASSATTSTSSTPLSVTPAPPSPSEIRAPRSKKLSHVPLAFAANLREKRNARRSLGTVGSGSSSSTDYSLSASCASGVPCQSPSPSMSTTSGRSEKRGWTRLAPWAGGWGGGTPGRSPRTPGRPGSARGRSFTFSAPTPPPQINDSVPPPPPSPTRELDPPVTAGPVAVLAAPRTTLKFSTRSQEASQENWEKMNESASRVTQEGDRAETGQSPGKQVAMLPHLTSSCVSHDSFRLLSVQVPVSDSGLHDDDERQPEGRWKRVVGDDVRSPTLFKGTAAPNITTHDGGKDEQARTVHAEPLGTVEPKTAVCLSEREMTEGSDPERLAKFLALGDRGWPWAGKDIVRAEYVSLSGHHRWVRSEGCRHAALLVGGAMFLLELPAEAVLGDSWRQANDAQRTSSSTTGSLAKSLQPAPSSTLPSTEHRPMRGWWLKIVAHSLQSLSVPMAKAEVELACNDKNVGGTGGRVPVGGDARGGLIIHTRNSSCAWVECESASRRDDLVQLIAAWHSAETKGRALKVCYLPQCEALDKVRASNGAAMRSLLSERKTCSW